MRDALGRELFDSKRADGSIERHAAPGQYVCDFCLASDPTWAYDCGEIRLAGNLLASHSDDAWLACERCHDFIEARDIAGLAEYAAREHRKKMIGPGWVHRPLVEAITLQRINVEAFMRARKGKPQRIDPKTAQPI